MATTYNLQLAIGLDGVPQVVGGLKQVESQVEQAGGRTQSATGRMREGMEQATSATGRMVGSARELAGMVGKLAGLFAGLSLIGVAQQFMAVNREVQSLKASLETVTGSQRGAEAAFAAISEFAKTTPYQLQEVTGAFIKLKALGLDSGQKSLQAYGNTASAMGKSLDQMIEAVADAATGEFERLKEFGIRASQQGDKVSFTFRGMTTTVAKSADEIEGYLRRIGEVQFAGAMERQMSTLNGRISNLQDNWAALMTALGESGGADAAADLISALTVAIERLAKTVNSFPSENGFTRFRDTILRGSNDLVDAIFNGKSLLNLEGTVGWSTRQLTTADRLVLGLPGAESSLGGRDNLDPTMSRMPYTESPTVKPPPAPTKEEIERAKQYAEALRQLSDARRASNPLLSEEAREAERLRIQYDNLVAKFPEHRSELERNYQLDLRQLQTTQALREEQERTKREFQALTAAMAEGQAVTDSVRTAQEKFAIEIERLNELFLAGHVGLEAYWRKIEQLEKTLEDTADKKVIDGLKEQLALLKLTGRELEVQKGLRQLSADATDAQREQVRRLTEQLYAENEAIEAQKKQADALKSVFEQALGRIDALFVDLWESGLQGFRDFSDQMKNTFRRLLAELIQMAVRNRIIIPIAGQMGLTGTAAAAGTSASGSAGGGLSSLGSLLNPAALGGMQESAAVFIADNISGSLGNALGSTSSSLFGGLTAGLGTALIGGLTTGDWGKSAISGIGAGIGMFFGGPLGAMVGGMLGNLAGSLFGGKPSDRTAWGSLDLASGELFDLGNMTGKKQSAAATLDARTAMLEATGAIAAGIRQLGGEIRGALTLQVGERDGIQVNIGKGVQRLGSDIQAALVQISELLVRNADWSGLLENSVFGLLTAEMQSGIRGQVEGGMDAQGVQSLVQYFGQLDAIMGQVSEAIKLADMDDYQRAVYGVNKQFDAMAEQLRALGVDLTKYTDLETARGLALRDLAEQFGQSAEAIMRAQLDILYRGLGDAVSVHRSAAQALREILGGPLGGASPERLYSEAAQAFEQARQGGRDAELPALGKALLEASRTYNASGLGYQADLERVTGVLGRIAGIEGTPTLSAAERQVQLLDDIRQAIVDENLAQLELLTSQTLLLQDVVRGVLAIQAAGRPAPAVAAGYTATLMPIQSFAVGSPYIPADMTANIHQGEMIIDRASAQVLRKYGIPAAGSDNQAVVTELKALRAEVAELKTHTAAGVRVQQAGLSRLVAVGETQAAASGELAGKMRLAAAQ